MRPHHHQWRSLMLAQSYCKMQHCVSKTVLIKRDRGTYLLLTDNPRSLHGETEENTITSHKQIKIHTSTASSPVAGLIHTVELHSRKTQQNTATITTAYRVPVHICVV